jgi:hypothetical protein
LGTVVHIKLKTAWGYANPDDGSVVVSDASAADWVFSTCWTESDLGHPVSGNRKFGYSGSEGGPLTFYTRGADRTTKTIDQALANQVVFPQAERLWLSLQRGIANFVNTHGGTATVLSPTSERHDWPAVAALYWHPTTPWI